jgi:hypothetical protein
LTDVSFYAYLYEERKIIMPETSSPQPAVIKDIIPPNKAPVAISPGKLEPTFSPSTQQAAEEDRAVARERKVIENLSEKLGQAPPTQVPPEQVQQRIEAAAGEEKAAEEKLSQAQRPGDVVDPSGLYGSEKFRKIMGKRSTGEQQQQIAQAEGQMEAAAGEKAAAEADLFASQVYSQEYLNKQFNPKRIRQIIEANQRGGPRTISKDMTKALQEQDALQQEMRYYQEQGINITPDQMLPTELYAGLRSQTGEIRIQRTTPEQINHRLNMMTAFYDSAIEYADAHGVQVDMQKLIEAIRQGEHITDDIEGRGVWDFIANKIGERDRMSASYIGYYGIGAYQLENFLRRIGIPPGEAQIPYIIAYAAGAIDNGAPQDMEHHLKHWLVDTLPSTHTTRVRDNSQWVDKQSEPAPRGLGSAYLFDRQREYWGVEHDGTNDPGLAEVMKKAGDTVRSIGQKMREMRAFGFDYSFQAHKITDPRLIKKE